MPASLTVIPWTLVEISEFLGQLPVDDDKKSQLNLSIASLCSELSYDPCFLWSSEVQGGSVGLNHPKLMSSEQVRQSIITPNLRKLPYDPGAQWFEEIRFGWTTTPNSCQTQPQAWFLIRPSVWSHVGACVTTPFWMYLYKHFSVITSWVLTPLRQ